MYEYKIMLCCYLILFFSETQYSQLNLNEVVEFMKKRQNPAALRFHKYKKDTDYKRFMRSEIMLYYPLKDEVTDDHIEELYTEMIDGKRKITIVIFRLARICALVSCFFERRRERD